jgi:hypothetical protein
MKSLDLPYVVIITAVALIVGGLMGYMIGISLQQNSSPAPGITVVDFQTCADAENPIMESYPRQCRANGQTYVEKISASPNQYRTYKGCSNVGDRVCVKAELAKDVSISTDIKAEDICRSRYSRCEPQPNGECGWTPSPKLSECISNPPPDIFDSID